MRGDFSRGHAPDTRRGARFRRVLLQQGRMLLDSDVNALVDAQDGLHRAALSDLGCVAGSPDYGFLITPGRLLRLFDDIGDVNLGGLTGYRDFGEKYKDRYPALYLENGGATPRTATIGLRAPIAAAQVRLWAMGAGAAAAGGAFQAVAGTSLDDATDITAVAGATALQVRLAPGEALWIGMVEELQPAGTRPAFWVADGAFHLGGLHLRADAAAMWSAAALDALVVDTLAGLDPIAEPGFQPAPGMLPPAATGSGRVVAYLEGWERHIAAAEDAQIRELAIGHRLDTCTRTRALGQVKLARVPATATAKDVRAAFRDVRRGTGKLEFEETGGGLSDPGDPCSLPTLDGYRGPDNRLFRIEVRAVTAGSIQLVWSRDNGARLYPARAWSATELAFAPDHAPEGGDLVEVVSEAIALGDSGAAAIALAAPSPSFTPPVRQTGDLVELAPTGTAGTFTVPALTRDYGGPGAAVRARVWDGVIADDRGGAWHDLADGLRLRITGAPEVGDYWEYTARVGAGGDPRWEAGVARAPDGPERQFTPLALLEVPPVPATQPLALIAWLDHRFSRLCELEADDIAFDGAAVGEDATTVQEIIETLLEREETCCCEVSLSPSDDDLTARIAEAVSGVPGPIAICLEPGIYPIRTTLAVTRRLALRGCPDAILVDEVAGGAPLSVDRGGLLELVDVTVVSPAGASGDAIVDVATDARGVRCEGAGLLAGRPDVIAIRVGAPAPVLPLIWEWETTGQRILTPPAPDADDAPRVELEECVLAASWGVAATVVSALRDRGSHISCAGGGVFAVVARGVDLRGTAIVDGYDAVAFAEQLDPDALELDPDPALDALAARPPKYTGVGLAFGGLTGRFEECAVRAGIALYAETAQLQASDNLWMGLVGVHLRAASATQLHREHVTAWTGVHIPDTAVGVDIASCQIVALAAIALAVDYTARVAPRTMVVLTVADNQILHGVSGVQLGPAEGTWTGAVGGVHIRNNTIAPSTAAATGAGIRARTPPSSASVPGVGVRICGNDIGASTPPIRVEGPNFEVTDNRVKLPGGAERVGIAGASLDRATIADNLITLTAAVGDAARAIELDDSVRVRVTGNVVRAENTHTGLYASKAPGLEIRDNCFDRGSVALIDVDGVTLAGNRIGGTARITSTSHGSVHGNVLDGKGDSLIILGGSGWVVEANRATGWIRVLPGTFLYLFPGIIVEDFVFGAVARSPWRKAMEAWVVDEPAPGPAPEPDPALRERMGRLAEVAAARRAATGARGAARAAGGAVGDDTAAMSAQPRVLMIAKEGWRDEALAMLDYEIAGAAAGKLHDELPGFVLLPAYLGYEYTFEALVTGNHCDGLQVGYRHPDTPNTGVTGISSATPHAASVVQVTDNRARVGLAVNRYTRRVVAHNAAGAYLADVSPTTSVTTGNITG